jgi:hypothetical protein
MEMTIPHTLGQAEALRRIQSLLAQVKAQYPDTFRDLHESWTDSGGEFSATIMGMPVSGRLTVTPTQVHLTGDIPFAALPFKGQIEETIRTQAEQLLAWRTVRGLASARSRRVRAAVAQRPLFRGCGNDAVVVAGRRQG